MSRIRTFPFLPLLAVILLLSPAASVCAQVPVKEVTLANGMRLLMVERRDNPAIAGGWVAHVGSANERPGITGIAHLFEHMMFKGTPTLGTKDYEKDQQIIAEQERVRELMREEEANMRAMWRRGEITDLQDPDQHTARYRELAAEFKQLVEAQRELLVKNEFDRIYTTAGASGMNAFTSDDLTGYFINVPANKLELWMWMESERLLRPVFREFYAERDVVFEERRMRTESTPIGKAAEAHLSMFWQSHPYSWPTIGWPSDIPAISKAQADEFYSIYYAPQNITLILVGDFDAAEAEKLARSYFERIPRGGKDAPDVVTLEMPQEVEKRMHAEVEANPQVDIYWHTVPFQHPDSYPLAVLAQLLEGRTGRLYKGLVLGSEVATDTFAYQSSKKWAGLFNIGGEAREGKTPEEVEQGIYAELERLKTEPVPDYELQKVKNNYAANEYRKLNSSFSILYQLIMYDGLGDWREINDAAARLQAVTAADIQRVTGKYFTRKNRAVAIYTRKPGTGADEDPDLAGLAPDQKPIIQKLVGQLKAESDIEQLKAGLAQMEQRAGGVDAKQQQFFKIYLKKLRDRIAELENGK
ncbi:MAG TPA: insulinase family protein [Verrucomicrobiales bacterium]|nr:insulinase family protein [Verrucomicrobiales bacterium]